MRGTLGQFISYLIALGGFGILLIAFLDSTFLFLPFAIDLFVITQSANSGIRAAYYALMATLGSVAGIAVTYALARKGGEQGLARFGKAGRIHTVRDKMEGKAGWALLAAALMPPPFPFRVFVAVAAALNYPRTRLLAVAGAARGVRFAVAALLGAYFGPSILNIVRSPEFYYTMLALAAVSLLGTAVSIYSWAKRGG